MNLFSIRGGFALLAFAAASISFAQTPATETLQPIGVQKQVISSPINTSDFLVQIDEAYNYQPLRPENPAEELSKPQKRNNLPVGKLLNSPRAKLEQLFPAIGATGWVPPDPDLGVGPNHILAVVNSSIAWFTKAGVKEFQQTSGTFFAGMGAGSFQFDPKCFYDRVNQRYVLIFLEQDDATEVSKILMAVSDDNDPNGTWHRYRFEARIGITNNGVTTYYWLDYPGFGYNKDAYVVSGNMFGFTSGFAGVQFLVVPNAPALTGAPITVTSLRHSGGASAQVAEMISNTAANVYAISRAGSNPSTTMRVYSINSPGGTPTVTFTTVAVPSNSSPSMDAASTNNRFLDTIDGRVFNATWRNGKLVTAHNIQSGGFVASRWYEINTNSYPTNPPTISQSGDISSGSMHYFHPAISINSQGSLAAIFTGSSTTTTADLNFTGHWFTDAPGTMGAPQLLEASAGNSYASGRWGDYFGVDVDPVDDRTFWGIGMTVASNNAWRTSIFSWSVLPPGPHLQSLTLVDSVVPPEEPTEGMVTLTGPAPAGGAQVTLTSSNFNVGPYPSTITIPAGQTSAGFKVYTKNPPSQVTATITASYNFGTKSANLTIQP